MLSATVAVYSFVFGQWIHCTVDFSGLNTDGSFPMVVSNSFLSPLENNPIAADLE